MGRYGPCPSGLRMLVQLHIENYALIDRVVLEFGPGFNVLTGETGAGKSMIIGALGLILGQRAQRRRGGQRVTGDAKCGEDGKNNEAIADRRDYSHELLRESGRLRVGVVVESAS